MNNPITSKGAHALPKDIRKALTADKKAHAAWKSLTLLARNEWICWTISVKTPKTRKEHTERLITELKQGKRRPCCWMGCVHRADKTLSASQLFLLKKKRDDAQPQTQKATQEKTRQRQSKKQRS